MIIESNDIMSVRPIAQNIDSDARISPYINEAETLYIIPALGAKLYKEIDDDKSKHKTLLDGGYYDNDSRYFAGLTHAIAYLAYARFVLNQSVNVTPFGMMQKSSEFGTPASSATILAMSRESEKIGMEHLRQCVEYINFINGGNNPIAPKRKTKFQAIG